MDIIQEYLSNGKNLKNLLSYVIDAEKRRIILDEELKKHKLSLCREDNYYCQHYIYRFGFNNYLDENLVDIISNVNNVINKLKQMKRNKMILEIKLMINNLDFRSDSKLYKDFIDDKSEYSLDEIISIMKEMDFLYKHTNYSRILRDTRYNYIKKQREYNYYEHSEEDEEYVRNKAKKIALKEFKKNNGLIPDFSNIV